MPQRSALHTATVVAIDRPDAPFSLLMSLILIEARGGVYVGSRPLLFKLLVWSSS